MAGIVAVRCHRSLSVLLMARYGAQYGRIHKLWREEKHDLIRPSAVWRFFTVWLFGWVTLGLVALGVLTKRGVIGFS
ncbi:MAG: hypothetical protein ACT6S0_19165 [Roseateles sp.]|uniref:hypothetical protein n=1 Tax=Roseateles sp. TaxID=1971397 RepID=UPI004035DCDD